MEAINLRYLQNIGQKYYFVFISGGTTAEYMYVNGNNKSYEAVQLRWKF